MNLIEPMLIGGATATLLLGAGLDLRTRRIPNAVTFGSAALGFAVNLALRHGPGAGLSAEGWAAGIGVLILPFIARGVGGGDVKLLAAAGAWNGPGFVLQCLFWAALAGSALALGVLIARGQLWSTVRDLLGRVAYLVVVVLSLAIPWLGPLAMAQLRRLGVNDERAPGRKLAIPFGPALAAGGIIALALGTAGTSL